MTLAVGSMTGLSAACHRCAVSTVRCWHSASAARPGAIAADLISAPLLGRLHVQRIMSGALVVRKVCIVHQQRLLLDHE